MCTEHDDRQSSMFSMDNLSFLPSFPVDHGTKLLTDSFQAYGCEDLIKKKLGPQYLSPTKSSIFYALLRRGVSGDGVLLRQKNLARR